MYSCFPEHVIAKPGQGPIIINYYTQLWHRQTAHLEESKGQGSRVAQEWAPLPALDARVVWPCGGAHARGLRPFMRAAQRHRVSVVCVCIVRTVFG